MKLWASRPLVRATLPVPRPCKAALPPIDYDSDFQVRKVKDNGVIRVKGRHFFVGKAFSGEPVGLRQVGEAAWDVYFCHQRIVHIDLTQPPASSEEV